MRQLVRSRWFSLADLILVCLCGLLVYLRPQWGAWLIVVALLPWLLRLFSGGKPFERSGFEVPLILIVATAGVGIWAAYDKQAAQEKFWIIIAAIIIFIALVGQPKANIGGVAGLVGITGVIIATFFVLGNNWNLQSSDLSAINRVGRWIMAYRPMLVVPLIPPNFVGGLLGMIAPVTLILAYLCWRSGDFLKALISAIMGLLLLAGLILTSSRGAFLALLTGVGLWLFWRISLVLAEISKRSERLIFSIFLSLFAVSAVLFVSTYPGGLINLFDKLPGLASGESRLDLAISAGKLIGDYSFTGGGLRSFPGLYSQYVRVTPYFLFAYSHNFYLDVFLEQGLFGGFALLIVILGSVLLLARRIGSDHRDQQFTLLGEAVLIGLIVILIHGVVDDSLYGDLGTPLLLLFPGMAIMLVRSSEATAENSDQFEKTVNSGRDYKRLQKWLLLGSALLIIIMITMLAYRKPILARWYANLGAVEMSRTELNGWPLNKWNSNPDVSPIEPAEAMFSRAVGLNSQQRTSWHRLGLISLQSRDFASAREKLEKAHYIDPEHRGIRKALGYTYVWVGELKKAQELLRLLKETEYEMGFFSQWWRRLDRQDLALRAEEMEIILRDQNRFIQDQGENNQ